MDVIAHNLANVNTAGFKASRTTFTDVFSQTLQGASQANEATGRGGQNPMQVGLGSNLSAIDRRMTQGAAMRTDVPLDLMIDGEGFFIVSDATGTFFTRAGAFRLDPTTGWLVNDQGMPLMGWNTDESFQIQTGQLERIVLDRWTVPATSTSMFEINGNLDPTRTNPPPNMTMSFYDSIGTRWTMDVEFIPNFPAAGGNIPISWTVQFGGAEATTTLRREGSTRPEDTVVLDTGALGNIPSQTIFFDTDGGVRGLMPGANVAVPPVPTPPALETMASAFVFNIPPSALFPNAVFGQPSGDGATALANAIGIDFSRLNQFSGLGNDPRADRPLSGSIAVLANGLAANPTEVAAAGTATFAMSFRGGMRAGTFDGITVGADGVVRARYTNGEILPLAQIPIAIFRNPAGLQAVGNNLFVETANSGVFDGTGQDVSMSGATFMGGALEMSNVDLAAEFTDMIITQRGFQSNSRIISVSDEMLQILNNL